MRAEIAPAEAAGVPAIGRCAAAGRPAGARPEHPVRGAQHRGRAARGAAGGREAEAFRAADPDLDGYVIVDFDGFDEWFEEDERNVGHPRDPFHRIDIVHSSRHVAWSSTARCWPSRRRRTCSSSRRSRFATTSRGRTSGWTCCDRATPARSAPTRARRRTCPTATARPRVDLPGAAARGRRGHRPDRVLQRARRHRGRRRPARAPDHALVAALGRPEASSATISAAGHTRRRRPTGRRRAASPRSRRWSRGSAAVGRSGGRGISAPARRTRRDRLVRRAPGRRRSSSAARDAGRDGQAGVERVADDGVRRPRRSRRRDPVRMGVRLRGGDEARADAHAGGARGEHGRDAARASRSHPPRSPGSRRRRAPRRAAQQRRALDALAPARLPRLGDHHVAAGGLRGAGLLGGLDLPAADAAGGVDDARPAPDPASARKKSTYGARSSGQLERRRGPSSAR